MRTFTLTIRRVGEAYRVIAETSEPGLAAATRVDEPFVLDLASLPKSRTASMGHDAVLGYGTTLGNAAFVGKVGEAMQRAQNRADQAGEALHVLLAIEDADLVPLRWERLCGRLDGGWQFLRLQQRTPFSFYLPSENDKRYPAISRIDLRALVVVANLGSTRPFGLSDFDASETVKGVRAALGEIPCTVLASDGVEQVESAAGLPTLVEICERITKERYPILHVVCHGQFKRAEYEADELKSPAETYLFLRKSGQIDPSRPDDHVHRVSATEFVNRLRMLQGARSLPHLTFLCSCDTASPEAEQGLGGLGQRLVRDLGMPAVVAMTEPVAISLSERLSAKFYERLHKHGSVDRALSEASVGVAGHGQVLVPELFSRLAGRKLFDEIGSLTTGQWEYGLRQVLELVVERAPVLKGQVDDLADRARPALEIRRRTEHLPDQSDEMRRTDYVLRSVQATLNELCQDFLEDSFDHVAKGLPLTVPDYDGRCPFPGLGVFDAVRDEQGQVQEDFRPFFFGRDTLTEEIQRLQKDHRFVAVLGGSGSGKSSLVRAGLLTELRKERPDLRAIVFPPGREPLARLETELTNTSQPDIVVVDQFEELFTLCPDMEQRKRFLEALLPIREQCSVVITMRADFLGECADHDELYQLLDADDKHLKILQPLKGNDLRNAMEAQANAVKLQFEPGLAARIFEDIESEPGAMPLLQHCLRQLWQFRHGRWLKWSRYEYDERQFNATRGYQHVGGVTGAISRTAEDVYRNLSLEERELLPFIFERLARIDPDATKPEQRRDTRRREGLSQLTWEGGDSDLTKTVVSRLADAKLVITTQNPETQETEVEVAHEALIQHWQRLQGWLDDARDTARLVERIRNDADIYDSSQSSHDNLTLRGSVLDEAEALLTTNAQRLSDNEAGFVRLCRNYERQRKDKELRDAQILAEVQARRVLVFKRAAIFSMSLLVILTLVSAVAVILWHRASDAELAAQLEAANAVWQVAATARDTEHDTVKATSHFLQAARLFELPGHERSRDMALIAARATGDAILRTIPHSAPLQHRASFDEEASHVLTCAGNQAFLWNLHAAEPIKQFSHLETIKGAVFNMNHSHVLTWSYDHTAKLWNASTGECVLTCKHDAFLWGAAFLKQDTQILTWSGDGNARLWDITSAELIFVFPHEHSLPTAIVSPNETYLLTADNRGNATLWNLRTGDPVRTFPNTYVEDAIFSPDGFRVATYRGTAAAPTSPYYSKLWNVGDNAGPIRTMPHLAPVTAVAFAPDGSRLLTSCDDGVARLWDSTPSEPAAEFPHAFPLRGGRFSEDGSRLLTWSGKHPQGGEVILWDVETKRPLRVLPQFHLVAGAFFGRNDSWIVISSSDRRSGKVTVWDIDRDEPRAVLAHGYGIGGAVLNSTSSRLLTWSAWDEPIGTARVWDLDAHGPVRTVQHDEGALDDKAPREFEFDFVREDRTSFIFDHSGSRAMSFRGTTATLWDVGDSKSLAPLPHKVAVNGGAFFRNASETVTWASSEVDGGRYEGVATIWDDKGSSIHHLLHEGWIQDVLLTPDEERLITWSDDGVLKWWNPTTGKEEQTVPLDTEWIRGAAFSPDRTHILTWTAEGPGRVSKMVAWNSVNGTKRREFSVEPGDPEVLGAIYVADGSRVLTWQSEEKSKSYRVKLWNVETGEPLREFQHPGYVWGAAFDKAGTHFLTWGERMLLWNVDSTDPAMTFGNDHSIIGAKFSREESWILSWSEGGATRLWDVTKSDPVLSIWPKDRYVGATFGTGESQVITRSDRGTVEFWNIKPPGSDRAIQDHILEFEVRSATRLDSSGRLRTLSSDDWRTKSRELESQR